MLRNNKITYITLFLLMAATIISGCQKGHTPSPPTGDAQRASINISAVPEAGVVADGVTTVTLTAQVYSDTNVLAADGTEVVFTTNLGTFANTPPDTITATTTSGIATAVLTSSTTSGNAYVEADCPSLGVSATASVSFIEGPLTTITLSSPTTQISADGTSTTTVTASLYDANNNLVKTSTDVAFITTAGTLSAASVTTTSGTASVILTSSTTVETATIEVTVGTLAPVTIDVGFVVVVADYTITLQPSPSTIQANGASTSSITALLMDSNNNPLESQTISFSTTVGTITAIATTDDSGVATTILTSVREEATAIITATYGSISETINVRITGISLTIEANPKSVLSNGTSTSTITVTLKDASDIEIQAETITLTDTSVLGLTFTPTMGITDINGQFTATVSSSNDGDGVITATGAGASASDTVTFTALVFVVVVDSSTVETCGGTTEYVTVTADMKETDVGIAGQTVNLYSTHGGFTTTTAAVTCNATPTNTIVATDNGDGTYTAYFWGQETTGMATINAQATYDSTDLEDSVIVTISAITPANIVLTAAPNRIAYSGNTSTITALVTDSIGNPVANKLVSFQITNGPGTETLVPTTSLTDADGKATSTFTSGSLGSSFEGVTVEGSVEGAGATTITDSVKLTITGPPAQVAVGSANTLIDEADGLFKQNIIVAVKDIYGNNVADGTGVTLGVREVGFYTQDSTYFISEDLNSNSFLDCEDDNFNCVLDAGEDINGNGLLDCEDGSTGYMFNAALDPQSSAVIPSVATTSDGLASVQLQYAQSDACWIRVRIDAASGGIKANPLVKNLETSIQVGCSQAKYHTNINPAGSDSDATYDYSIFNERSVTFSIDDFGIGWTYTWGFIGVGVGAINGVVDGSASGSGLNSVVYTAPAAGSSGTDTVTVTDCTGTNSKLINITFSDPI